MTEIKEVNALGTIASIRKATQDSLKPVIEEIERKMVALNLETTQIASKVDKIADIQKRQGRLEETIHYMQSQILELKEQSQSLQLQQTIDKAQRQRQTEENQEQFRKLTREKQKQAALLQSIKDKNDKVAKELSQAQSSMKAREEALEVRFKNLSERSQTLGFEIKANSDKLAAEFQQIRSTLSHELKSNSRRLQLLDMFEAEKDITAKKIDQISISLQSKVNTDEYDFFKDCIGKEQQRVVNSVKKIIEDNLSQKTRDLLICLPQMRDQIIYCLTHDQRIAEVNKRIDEIRVKFSEDHNETLSIHNQFKTTVFDRFVTVQEERVVMSKNISKALSFEGEMIERLDQYSEKLKVQLRDQNYRKSRQLYEQIKETFADKKQQLRERQFQRIIQERQRLFDRAKQMQNLASKIGQILTNFSTRITKVKSDNQMFVQKVKKQLLVIEQLRRMIVNDTDLIGQTLSQIMETVLINNCIEIEEESKHDEEIAFSTHEDGVIYQKFLAHSKGTDSGVIVYRRKSMNTKYLKRALVASITQIYDKLMDQDNCLCWKDHSPSLFFRQHIEPTYQNLLQNHIIDEKSRKTVQSSLNHRQTIAYRDTPPSLQPIDGNNRKTPSTQRSRRTRYEDNSIFFTKSARRVRGSLSNTIALE